MPAQPRGKPLVLGMQCRTNGYQCFARSARVIKAIAERGEHPIVLVIRASLKIT